MLPLCTLERDLRFSPALLPRQPLLSPTHLYLSSPFFGCMGAIRHNGAVQMGSRIIKTHLLTTPYDIFGHIDYYVKLFFFIAIKRVGSIVSSICRVLFSQLVIIYFIVNINLHFRNIVCSWLPKFKLGIVIVHDYRKHCLHLILYGS